MNPAIGYMVVASFAFALSGVAVHGLGSDGWDLALLSRALFGLPYATAFFLTSANKSAGNWRNKPLSARSITAVCFLAFLYFVLQKYSPGESFTLASMRPLWVAGLSMLLGLGRVKWIFWPLSSIAIIGIGLMEGAQMAVGFEFAMTTICIGLLGGISTLAIDFCKGQDTQFMTLHLTTTMLLIALIAVVANGHFKEISTIANNGNSLALYSAAGLGGTIYQIFSIKAVKKIGAVSGSAIALMATLFAWGIGHLIWKEPSQISSIVGIILALAPCSYLVFGGSLLRSKSTP